jgi:hypothetical protein
MNHEVKLTPTSISVRFNYTGRYNDVQRVCETINKNDGLYAFFDEDVNVMEVETSIHKQDELWKLYAFVNEVVYKSNKKFEK